MTPATLAVEITHPTPLGIIARAACFIPNAVPFTFTRITRSNSSGSKFTMLLFLDWFPSTPALLNIMSSCPYRETVDLTRFSTSSSTLTSQCTKLAHGANVSATIVPNASSTSAITTLAPFFTKTRTVASPIPLAPPVTMATLPSNLYNIVQHVIIISPIVSNL
ncbi:hypothetical protein CR513_59335, partial [Mucuna pruriens]